MLGPTVSVIHFSSVVLFSSDECTVKIKKFR